MTVCVQLGLHSQTLSQTESGGTWAEWEGLMGQCGEVEHIPLHRDVCGYPWLGLRVGQPYLLWASPGGMAEFPHAVIGAVASLPSLTHGTRMCGRVPMGPPRSGERLASRNWQSEFPILGDGRICSPAAQS